MPLTRSFKSLVAARMEREPSFKQALLAQAMTVLMDGDIDTGKSLLRDYINATVGFEALAAATGTPSKSLMRMFGRSGNPTAKNLFAVIARLQQDLGVTLEVRAA
ncbi:MAG: transcriptional regulator [Pseudomonadota bacterium]|nr:transcriptional regulator [Pseudomonadota bacterium]